MTIDHGASLQVSADVVIVSMSDAVLLVVSGSHTSENVALVDEVRSTLIETGTPPSDIAVLWS